VIPREVRITAWASGDAWHHRRTGRAKWRAETARRPAPLSALLEELARAPRHDAGPRWEVALCPGAVIGRFELVREIARGGFGIVWEAKDRTLQRTVAFKALRVGDRPEVGEERLLAEAEAAARLSHPSIVTLHDVGRTPHGPYLVLEFLRGRTLAARLADGPLPLAEALRIAAAVASGLAHAHAHGVVHRDLTPGNVFLCDDGQVKVLDLGMAHAFGHRKLDGGTPAYMAPEQRRGAPEDERTDVFALGVILYEMLSGEPPFPEADPGRWRAARRLEVPGTPPSLAELVADMLRKDPVRRPRDAARVLEVLAAIARHVKERGSAATPGQPSDQVASSPRPRPLVSGGWRTGALVAAVAVLVGVLALSFWQRQRERNVRATELPRLQALVAADDCVKAFDLVLRLEPQLPGDPQVRALAEACSSPVRPQTDPPGALVSFRPYDADDSAFRPLGRTPLRDVRVPHGVGVFRFELVGRTTVLRVLRNPGLGLGNVHDPSQLQQAAGTDLAVPLPVEGAFSPAMVLVPATRSPVSFVSDVPVAIAPYLLGRFEVTNREFKEFVDAGGYQMERLWRDLPFGAAVTSWQEAVARFVDSTGRPGPSTWESGFYPDGAGDHPVAGVSWFEATAYARFRGLELPTAYHWYRAAFSLDEITESISAAVARRGNFQGRGTEPVGQRADLGPYGTSDMAGNVREWLSTARGAMRMVAGGAFNQGPYLYYTPDAADPWDRSPGNGLRLMRTADGTPMAEALRLPVDDEEEKLGDLRPVEDAAWAVLEQQLGRSSAPLDARQEVVAPGVGAWRRDTVSLATGYDEGRFRLQLFLPIGRPPPWQVVVLLPHAGYFGVPEDSAAFDPSATSQRLDFLMKTGRALVLVVFDGMFERRWPDARRAATSRGDRYRILLRHHREEIGRALDYLQGRKEFDAARAGVLGFSYGAQAMVSLLAVEPRLGPAVLIGGGVFFLPGLPVAEQPFNYYPHVRQPVLMLSGRWDIDVGPAAQEAMLRLLGSPEEQKRRVVSDVGHGWVPQNQFVREALEWFDRYLGPVR